MLNHITFLFCRSFLQLCNKLAVGWEWKNEIFMLSHMAFLYQFNSHHNESNYYYRISFTFFCSDFAAYIRRNTVSYGFYAKIFMLNAASHRGRPISGGEWFLFHDLKNKLLLLIDCSYFHWNDFFGNPVCYLVRKFTWTTLGPCHLFHPPPQVHLVGNFSPW